jgi:hypothetical protein
MWVLVVVGIFSFSRQMQVVEVDDMTLREVVEMSGDMTISTLGFTSEASCREYLKTVEGKHQMTINGVKMTMHSAECREQVETPKGK